MASLAVSVVAAFACATLAAAAGELKCNPGQTALCANDMNVVNGTAWPNFTSPAGGSAFGAPDPSAKARETLVQLLAAANLSVSDTCLTCQANAIGCGTQQTTCLQLCQTDSCGHACRLCNEKACSVKAACGGVLGETIQSPSVCAVANDMSTMAQNATMGAEAVAANAVNCAVESTTTAATATTVAGSGTNATNATTAAASSATTAATATAAVANTTAAASSANSGGEYCALAMSLVTFAAMLESRL